MQRMWDKMICWGVTALIFLLSCCWLLMACGTPQESGEEFQNSERTQPPIGLADAEKDVGTIPFPEGVVAIVNGEMISEEHLSQRVQEILTQADLTESFDANMRATLRKEALEELIENLLIAQLASQQHIVVTEEELEFRISQVEEEYQGQDIQTIVQQQGEVYEDWIQAQREALLLEKVIQRNLGSLLTVTREDARQYYEEHPEQFELPSQIRASQILVYKKSTARQALQALDEGLDFAEVAQIYSESPDAAQGGDLGFFTPGTLPPDIEKAILSLETDEVSDIVKTPYGYQLFRLTGQRPAQRASFEEVEAQILSMLRQQKRIAAIDMWITELQKNAKILLNHEQIENIE